MELNPYSGVGKGKFRQPYRIREVLAKHGKTMASVARELGIHPSLVAHTVRGMKNNKVVLDYLQKLGCPAEYLGIQEEKA